MANYKPFSLINFCHPKPPIFSSVAELIFFSLTKELGQAEAFPAEITSRLKQPLKTKIPSNKF